MSYKEGDLFEVIIDEKKMFFQFLAIDESCLHGDVIRAFDFESKCEDKISLVEIVKNNVKFYAHTSVKAGVKLGVWKRIDSIKLEQNFVAPTFRHTEDVADSSIKKSYNWYIWKVNGPTIDIGELTAEYASLSVGGLTHPFDIVERLKTGIDPFKYPD